MTTERPVMTAVDVPGKNKTRMPKAYGLMGLKPVHCLSTPVGQVGDLGLKPFDIGLVQVEILGLGMMENHGGY